MDDIYEYKTDHQYFTHTGATRDTSNSKYAITNETQRNCLFKNYATHSLDEYGPYIHNAYDVEKQLPYRSRIDNTSFIRDLNSSISQSSVDSGHNTGGSTTSSNNSKEKLSSKSSHHHHHHHSSIQEMIRHIGKKVHMWPRNRHESINENGVTNNHTVIENQNEEIENFRTRSKSLDVSSTQKKVLDDCEATYKIYNSILKEGRLGEF